MYELVGSTCHLSGFQADSSEIKLNTGLIIKQVPIAQEVYDEPPSTISEVKQEFGVEWYTKEPRRIDRGPIVPDFQKTKSIFQRLITSLRLFKTDDVGLDSYGSNIKLRIPIDPKSWNLDYPVYSDNRRNYYLSKHDEAKYVEQWKQIKALTIADELETAINRFHLDN